jgi:UDP-sulfoquinovose synthase
MARDFNALFNLLASEKPDAMVHFAEQPAAPYSMKSSCEKIYTFDDNLNATHSLLCAIAEIGLDLHVIPLGAAGVYGYGTSGMKIPEGHLNVRVASDEGETLAKEILYSANPGSFYHMIKTHDQLFFAYHNKNDKIRTTECIRVLCGKQTPHRIL